MDGPRKETFPVITIVDYGLGNVQAFSNMYKRLGFAARRATNAAELEGATKLILPGVGAFDHAMELLNNSGMRASLDNLVLQQQVPVLGVCVGMQILANHSEEGRLPGLGWVPGKVRAFKDSALSAHLPLPHMGWNDVNPAFKAKLFAQLDKDIRFYFLHSFFFECAQPESIMATSRYGLDFSCAVAAGNVYGVQFHPEKSHHCGSQLLKNFAEL
jgi:imidazole glycerol-phosphate synthase subunit HisH